MPTSAGIPVPTVSAAPRHHEEDIVYREVTEEQLDDIIAAFNAHDVESILEHFADDAVFYMASGPEPVGRIVKGKAAIAQVLSERFVHVPDLSWTEAAHHVLGDYGVSVWRVSGHVDDGEQIDVRGCDLWQFEAGRVVHKDTYWKQVRASTPGLAGG